MVVIYGEIGTGKELAARTIHRLSDWREQPFVAVNCSAIPANLCEQHFFGSRKGAFTDAASDRPGYFEAARAGVLFLDEDGELPLTMQAKLLRVLQNGEYTPVGDTRSRTADVRALLRRPTANYASSYSRAAFAKISFTAASRKPPPTERSRSETAKHKSSLSEKPLDKFPPGPQSITNETRGTSSHYTPNRGSTSWLSAIPSIMLRCWKKWKKFLTSTLPRS
jgi:hypothetical protein